MSGKYENYQFGHKPTYLHVVRSLFEKYHIFQKMFVLFFQVIISLAQEHRRSQRDRKIRLLQIGFCLYQIPTDMTIKNEKQATSRGYETTIVPQTMPKLDNHFFAYNYDVGTSGPYINYREVFARFELAPGSYVIVPATFEPNCPGKFMIRVYNSSSKCYIHQL